MSEREFNSLYAQARRQTALMALTSGDFEWRNYRGILRKARTMLFGKPGAAAAAEPAGVVLPPGAGLPTAAPARVDSAVR